MRNIRLFLSENFHFLVVKFSVYLNRRVFVMIIFTPLNPLLHSKTGVYKGIHKFSYFCSKHITLVHVRTAYGGAVLTSTHNLYFEHKYEKYQIFLFEKFPFLIVKFSIYLNSHVFVMMPTDFSVTMHVKYEP